MKQRYALSHYALIYHFSVMHMVDIKAAFFLWTVRTFKSYPVFNFQLWRIEIMTYILNNKSFWRDNIGRKHTYHISMPGIHRCNDDDSWLRTYYLFKF